MKESIRKNKSSGRGWRILGSGAVGSRTGNGRFIKESIKKNISLGKVCQILGSGASRSGAGNGRFMKESISLGRVRHNIILSSETGCQGAGNYAFTKEAIRKLIDLGRSTRSWNPGLEAKRLRKEASDRVPLTNLRFRVQCIWN